MNEEHGHWMLQAIEMALENPRAPFGAVIVHAKEQRVLSGGVNHTADGPIWHGEMDAIGQLDGEAPFADAILYTTAEPCSMCQSAILWAGIPTLVYGTSIPTIRAIGWDQIDLRAEEVVARSGRKCTVIGGVLEERCDELFRQAMKLRSVALV